MDSQISNGNQPEVKDDRTLADLPDGVIANILARVGACNANEVFRLRSLCKTFSDVVDSAEVYRQLDADSLYPLNGINLHKIDVLEKMRENGNPNMLFRDGMNKFFSRGDEAAGKEMLQQASDLGQVDATFVLGMLLMGEGHDGQAEAKQLLTSARTRLAGQWDVPRTANKVREILAARLIVWQATREWPTCKLDCPVHKVHGQSLRNAFINSRPWVLDCNVCLWEACYIDFLFAFGIFFL